MLVLALIAVLALSTPSSESSVSVAAIATPTPMATSKNVREAAQAAGYGREIADKLAGAAQGAAMIESGEARRAPSEAGTSRFGGDPDLPTGARWPQCKGKPQTFLGQVRVSDLPPEAEDLRRLGGTLLFFTAVEFEPGEREYGLWAGDCSKVVHTREGASTRRVKRPARGVLDITSAPMRFTGRPDIPELDGDHLAPPLTDVRIDAWEPYTDFRDALRANIYPRHKLLGYLDEPNGGNTCSERAYRTKGTWRHLFTLDESDALGFNVADAGRIQLLISPADLQRGRFDRVCGVFDSA